MVMVMVFIYRIFYMYIFKCGLHLSHVQGWDRTSAYIGAEGSRYQPISDLTQPTQAMNHEIAQRPDQYTGNSTPYSLR